VNMKRMTRREDGHALHAAAPVDMVLSISNLSKSVDNLEV
jgi:hypothetical protein